jgi:hypothetical protein
MGREHRYRVEVEWTGNRGTGTSSYRAYDRDREIRRRCKLAIAGYRFFPNLCQIAQEGDIRKLNWCSRHTHNRNGPHDI